MKLGFVSNNALLKKIEIRTGNDIIEIRIGKSQDNEVTISNKFISTIKLGYIKSIFCFLKLSKFNFILDENKIKSPVKDNLKALISE